MDGGLEAEPANAPARDTSTVSNLRGLDYTCGRRPESGPTAIPTLARLFRLIPELEFRPGFRKRLLEIVAGQNVVILPAHAVVGSDGRPLIDAAAPALGALEAP